MNQAPLFPRGAGAPGALRASALALLLGGAALLGSHGVAHAYARYFLEAGSPCGTCHVAPQGGGIRNSLGWYQASHTGLLNFNKSGMPDSSGFLGDKVWSSGDFRFQMARTGRPTATKNLPDQRWMVMQTQVNLGIAPRDWLQIVGGVNAIAFDDTKRYAGQAPGEIAVQLSPGPKYPTVRAGLIQPSIGIRPDDHTMMLRANAADPRRPFIPPMYVEPGLELSYHPISWVQAQVGVFSNHYLQDTVSNLNSQVAFATKLMFLPQILDWGVNTWAGVSSYSSGDFLMVNGFLGIGVKGKVSLQAELAETHWELSKKSRAWALIAGYSPWGWLHVFARVEQAAAAVVDKNYTTWQTVAGVQFNPLPFLEIRPEYRYLVTDSYKLGYYGLQFYAYY